MEKKGKVKDALDEIFYRILFIASYAVFASVRVYYRSKTRGREEAKTREKMDWSGAFLSFAILGYFIAVGLYLIAPDWIQLAYIELGEPLRLVSFGVSLLGAFLVLWIHRVLGEQYSALQEIQQNHKIITAGPYSRVRHPMYTVFILFSISVSLISSNLLLIVFALLVSFPFPWLARNEERMLTEEFGQDYVDYMSRTGRFLPPLRRKSE
ncbi:MAG: methyltransferase [Candidatus Thorarchaeota archaeon]|jgi:protein-S-isoprenylcysteine O-methyltransferase Ste14